MNYDDLSNGDKVLLEAETGALKVEDVQILLDISASYAANILRELWGKKLLSRRAVRKKKGGKKYSYKLMDDGEKIVKWLHIKGY
jgi:predicted transcriptional regulator